MKLKIKLVLAIIIIFFSISSYSLAFEHNKYSLQHSEEMKHSGRIKWQDYGKEAFNEAARENKPIFQVLTAPTWCFWCHVLLSEDYIYNEKLYPYINENTIPVYINADKRQDLTRQYLEGGWPSVTVFTPDRKRIFGFSGARPPENILANLKQATELVKTSPSQESFSLKYEKKEAHIPTVDDLQILVENYYKYSLSRFDNEYGGFGTGQKFPQPLTLDAFLDNFESTKDVSWLEPVEKTLENQFTKVEDIETNYNLFDPIEGGFHRYGTQRNWTPPHYEKMLYDNVKLLQAYAHLLLLKSQNTIAKKVVDMTKSFISERMFDHKIGGFSGNVDVHGEDEYYGKVNRPQDSPFVDKTIYTDWNSIAISSYFVIGDKTKDDSYKEMAKKALDFLLDNLTGDSGAYHYIETNGSKGVTGNILDNAYFLHALVEGYKYTGEEKYLSAAKTQADYILENLYDWNSGGFFERNSKDTKLYIPNELILTNKPAEENYLTSYALANLYQYTNDVRYLNSSVKSFGQVLDKTGILDGGYYAMKTAKYFIQNNLLQEYEKHREDIEQLENNNENFWLNRKLNPEKYVEKTNFEMSEEGLKKLESPLFLLILIAFIAGLLSFLEPCTLPILPAYLACTLKTEKEKQLLMSLSFLLGLSILFSLLGMTASSVGQYLMANLTMFSQIAGIILIIFGFYILSSKGLSGIKIKHKEATTYLEALWIGATMGLSWTPCTGPILASILILASTTSHIASGGLLLFVYGIGLGVPLLIISFTLEKINKDSIFWKVIKGKELKMNVLGVNYYVHSTTLMSGILFVILGFLIFNGALIAFNKYVISSELQQIFFVLEEKILSLITH